MSNRRTVIPFGPQHPVLPEPIHLDLVVEDEHVVEAIPSIGYVHRGLESLVDRRDYSDFVFLAERICGICSPSTYTLPPCPHNRLPWPTPKRWYTPPSRKP